MPDQTGDGINDVDITNAGDSTTIDGVIFTDAVNVGSGTGNYNTFLAISNNSGVESGFNSDDKPPIDNTNKDIDQAKTHTVLLSSLVQVTINGVQYYQVRIDLNEANSDPNAQISLDQFKIYSSSNGGIESTTTLFTQNLIYDMDATGNVSLLLSDAGSTGSGTDDYAILIPVTEFAGLDPATTYVYFYVQMGAADGADWNAGATFEEFNLENGVTLTGTKFSDVDGDGVRDAGEAGVGGVTIFIDSNQNGVLDAGERTTVIDSNGNYSFFGVALNQTLWIDEVTPSGAIQTTGAHETITIPLNATPGSSLVVDPIGNHYLTPHVTISKAAEFDDGSDCADTVGELINYTVTVTNDGELALSNVVVTDSFEGGSDVTITGPDSGDDNSNGVLDVGETWTYTYTHAVTQDDIDSNGGDDDGTLDNTATVNADSSNGSVSDDDDAAVDVCQNPHITVAKDATVDGDCADTDGELINYTISVTNDGNVTLDTVVVTDTLADSGSVQAVDEDSDGFNDGDTDADGKLDVGETWLYTAYHTVTQDEIDAGGNYDSSDPADGILDSLRNVATATAEVVGTDTEVTDDDDALVDVCQNPGVDIEKYVMTDVNGAFVDADDPNGPEASTSSTVDFKVVLTNTGNVTLTDITLSDSVVHTVGGVAQAPVDLDYSTLGAFIDLDNDGVLDVGVEEWSRFDTNGDGTLDDDGSGNPFELAVGDSLTIYYSLTSELGQHENTVEVTTAEGVGDNDDANYFVLPSEDCVGVRTPGFWSNPKWMTFWDAKGDGWGTAPNEPAQAGTPGFADGELLYKVYLTDSNHDGVINGDPTDGIADDAFSTGLLIGDYNMNGITDAGEDTIFISLPDAIKLINASSKQLVEGKGTADGIFMLGRDMVATWLNYLANNQGEGDNGNCIGTVAGATNSPREFLDAAIDWMQQFASTSNADDTASHTDTNTNTSFHDGNTQATFEFDSRVNPSSASWQTPVTVGEDIPVSGAAMHAALDAYNNTGAINGIEYCCDADSEIALSAIAQII